MTLVDRQTRCVLGWKVARERSAAVIQQLVDEAPKAREYFSDGWEAYATLWYQLGQYSLSDGKSDTYSVEAANAEFCHYLARLAEIFPLFLTLSCCLAVRSSPICLLFQFQAVA